MTRDMRIVSWNMNWADHRQSHHEAWAFLQTLEPDIALVQEAVVPDDFEPECVVRFKQMWPNLPWGSAVLSRVGDLNPDGEDPAREAPLVVRSSTSSIVDLCIVCVHAPTRGGVIPRLRPVFEGLRNRIGERFIVGGDLNTGRTAEQQWPGYGHGKFWTDVEAWGFKEPLPFGGHERQSFWRGWLINEPPTIGNSLQDDHIFLDEQTFELVDACAIWDTKEVRELSDHGPVVVDLRLP